MPASNNSATVIGDNDNDPSSSSPPKGKGKQSELLVPPPAATTFLTQTKESLEKNANRQFFIPIKDSTGGLIGALQQLNEKLIQAGRDSIISKKEPFTWIGRRVEPGFAGLFIYGGVPKLLLKPGRYPSLPWANWWAREWVGAQELSSTVFSHSGLVAVQVSQNQAAVVADPSNNIFIIRDGGFVSLSIEGSYRCLAVVDSVNLARTVVDPFCGGKEKRVLGTYEEVVMESNGRKYVVATFLDIPANNCVILQRGDELERLPAGQHVITHPNITVRGWFTQGESQLEMMTKDLYTSDQVPVQLRMYLRWQLLDPLRLCLHGYSTPYEALQDKTLSCLTQIVSHLAYASLLKQRGFNTGDDAHDAPEPEGTPSAFLDAVRTQAMDELHEAAKEYGILLREVAVLDRNFKGQIATTMDTLTTRSLQAQVEASNVDRENSNRVKLQQGLLEVSRVQAQQTSTEADAAAYKVIANAKAQAQARRIAAEAEAQATRIAAEAEAAAIALRAKADDGVQGEQAMRMQWARNEIKRVAAYGDKTVFVPQGAEGAVGGSVLAGFGLARGGNVAQ